MAGKKRKKVNAGSGLLFAVLFAAISLVFTFFMLGSLRDDIEKFAWMIEDPNKPQPTMPVRATPTPASTPKSTATPIESPSDTDDEAQPTPTGEGTNGDDDNGDDD